LIAERGVQAAAIIVIVDEGFDVAAQVLEINIIVSIDLFALERLHKTLTASIVVGIRRPTHAGESSGVLAVPARTRLRHTARHDRNDGPNLAQAGV